MDEFLDEFKGIKVGGKIRIKWEVIKAYDLSLVDFVQYAMVKKNRFTVKTIQEFEDDVNICVYEVRGVLGSTQVDPLSLSNRILNWRRP